MLIDENPLQIGLSVPAAVSERDLVIQVLLVADRKLPAADGAAAVLSQENSQPDLEGDFCVVA